MRTRDCHGPFHFGKECAGANISYEKCNTQECPIDGIWTQWTDWGECTLTCGNGTQDRFRTCIGPFYGGAECAEERNQTQLCNTFECPIDGVLSEWSQFYSCNVTCGGGIQWRNRSCIGPFYGGQNCTEPLEDSQDCNTQPCPIDGLWFPWTAWGACNVTCGGGIQWRNRVCDGPFHGGLQCIGEWNDSQSCNEHHCPVDGVWEAWSNWTTCNVTCGGGMQWRERTCDGPFYEGANCSGPYDDERKCNTHHCPVDGVFTSWSAWEECSLTCGTGIQWRNRSCDGPFYGGQECIGAFNDSRDCNTFPCPIDGVWTMWTPWSGCPVTCGGGTHSRTRICEGPFNGGANCTGAAYSEEDCNMNMCPVDGAWAQWNAWTACTASCGTGSQVRNRMCVGPFNGGMPCEGEGMSQQECNTNPCPVDGEWNTWAQWGDCNVTCGGGFRLRNRTCDGPYHEGAECQGPSFDTEICSTNPCPIPGDWFPWSQWTLCSTTCGGGTRSRDRVCDMDSYGDLTIDCLGDSSEIGDCHTFPCRPLAIHCADWQAKGLNQTCEADIDPDGPGLDFGSKKVECDFDSIPGEAITILHHDYEERHEVRGFEGAGEYQLEIYNTYHIGWAAAIRVIDSSAECRQYLKWECLAAIIHNPYNPEYLTTFWKNRTEQMTNYFGGAEPGSGNCACGMTNSCYNSSLPCNCDSNVDNTWLEDAGYLTNKAELPVHSFYAGDTGAENEDGKRTIGPVECWGLS